MKSFFVAREQGVWYMGIWVGSHPLIHSNRIKDSGDTGIAFVNDIDPEHETQQIRPHYRHPLLTGYHQNTVSH